MSPCSPGGPATRNRDSPRPFAPGTRERMSLPRVRLSALRDDPCCSSTGSTFYGLRPLSYGLLDQGLHRSSAHVQRPPHLSSVPSIRSHCQAMFAQPCKPETRDSAYCLRIGGVQGVVSADPGQHWHLASDCVQPLFRIVATMAS